MVRACAEALHRVSHVNWIDHSLETGFEIPLGAERLGKETPQRGVSRGGRESQTRCRNEKSREQRAHWFLRENDLWLPNKKGAEMYSAPFDLVTRV